MQIAALLLLEGDMESLAIKLSPGDSITDDWSEPGNEQDLDALELLHVSSSRA